MQLYIVDIRCIIMIAIGLKKMGMWSLILSQEVYRAADRDGTDIE